jgi:hypothetical protein
MENIFVSCVLLLSGAYITQRLKRTMSQGPRGGCNSCSSSTCTPASPLEQELPMARGF